MTTNARGRTVPVYLAIALTIAGIGAVYALFGMPPIVGAEDAAIGFRYARNLAEGHGLVFNPGGERVEGFTSLSWALLSGALYFVFGPGGLEISLFLVSIAFTVTSIAGVLWLTFELCPGRTGRALAVGWTAALPLFYHWSGLSLMDVAPWTALLVLFVVALYLRLEGRAAPRGALAALAVGLALTRPDAMAMVPAILAVGWLAYGATRAWRTCALEAGVAIVVAEIGLTLFRLAYFGYPLPNTYYTKVPPDVLYRLTEGWLYVRLWVEQHPVSLVALVTAAAYMALGARARLVRAWEPSPATRGATLAAGFSVMGLLSVVSVGGDHYEGHRFLQAYLPMLAVPLAVAAHQAVERAGARRGARRSAVAALGALALLLPAADWGFFATKADDFAHQSFTVALQGRAVGEALGLAFEGSPLPEVGLWMVGGAGYAYPGPVRDLLGLNWVAMGHSPGDRKGIRDHAAFNIDVFWTAPPHLMIPEPEPLILHTGCVRTIVTGLLRGLLRTPEFEAAYQPVRVHSPDFPPIILYGRSDWLADAPPAVEPLGWAYCADPAAHQR